MFDPQIYFPYLADFQKKGIENIRQNADIWPCHSPPTPYLGFICIFEVALAHKTESRRPF